MERDGSVFNGSNESALGFRLTFKVKNLLLQIGSELL